MGKESNPSRNKTRRKANQYFGLKKPQIKGATFLKKIRLFGYHPDEDGVCYGLSTIALHFILLNQLTQFDQLILAIYRINHKVRKGRLAERALIEGVQFCHHPGRYPHLFPTYTKNKKIKPVHDIANSLSVIASDELEAQGGAVCVDRFSGVYTISEFTQLFQCMRTSIEQFSHTMALLLSDDVHICVVTYSMESRAWSRIDTICLPSQKYISDLAIAKAVARSLSVDLKKTVISGIVFVCGQSESIAKQAVAHRYLNKDWERIHAMDMNKKKYFPRWLLVSCYDGCEKNVQLLLENNADPNKPRNEGCSPLYFSIKHGYYSVVKLLLSHGASVNRTHKDEMSPLSAAIKYGRDDIAALLRENGAKLRSRIQLHAKKKCPGPDSNRHGGLS